jgi:DNA-binding YbaB/EbfC family protein
MPQPNIQNMLKQAQEVMAAQQEAQEALKEQKVEASAGGGMVKVVVSGDLRLESLTIDPDAVDPEDVEMLQDLVLAATNEALRQAVALQEKAMEGASGAGGFDPMEALQGLGLGDALGGLGMGPAHPGAPGGLPGGAPAMNRAARRAAAKKNR